MSCERLAEVLARRDTMNEEARVHLVVVPLECRAVQEMGELIARRDLSFWDVAKSGDRHVTAGYDEDGHVLLGNAQGFTMHAAWESPIRRYEALHAMGFL